MPVGPACERRFFEVPYTAYHFSHEERLMLKYGYEGYEEHRDEHEGLVTSAKKLRQHILQKEGIGANEELEFMESWLTEHILADDKALGSYLLKVM
jgi:hemerythrin